MNRRPDFASMILVTIVALLIWLVAEDYTSEDVTLQTRLGFTATNAKHYVVQPSHTEVTLQLGGPKRAINKMRTLMQDETLSINSPARNGMHTFEDLAMLIQSLPEVRETGVSIDSVDPSNFQVHITELASVDAVVRARMPEGALVQDSVVSPEKATITLPKDEAARLPESPTLVAVVDAREIQHLEPGVLHTINGSLRLPEEFSDLANVQIDPATARVSFRLVARNRSITLDKVYLQILVNPDVMTSFKVTLPDSLLRSVQVEASTALAEQLESNDGPSPRVVAIVPLSNLELEQGIKSKPVAYFLALAPDGTGETVSASVDGNAHPDITLQITKIPAATATPAAP
jgi:hypothetical protein